MVRAKFTCSTKAENADGTHAVTLFPVTQGSPENEEFYKWTPSGTIELRTLNERAAAQFAPGKSYYVDFTAEE